MCDSSNLMPLTVCRNSALEICGALPQRSEAFESWVSALSAELSTAEISCLSQSFPRNVRLVTPAFPNARGASHCAASWTWHADERVCHQQTLSH
jgi:hypothetical protein